jgi:hypothetical protein
MRAARPYRAVPVAVLLLSLTLTTACGRQGRVGAGSDRAALQKALSSVATPRGLTSTGGVTPACVPNSDCPEIGSSVTYKPVRGNLEACTAAVGLHGRLPALTVSSGSATSTPFPGSHPGSEVLAGVAALRPSPARMTAACVTALEPDPTRAGNKGEAFVMVSDLQPTAVPVKSAEAVVTVENHHRVENPTGIVISLTYTGPGLYPEAH